MQIQYNDGEFLKEHKAADGIATTAQYYYTESTSEVVPAPIQSLSCPTPDSPPSSTNSNTEIKIASDAARSAVVVTLNRAPSSSRIFPDNQMSASIHRAVLDSSNQDTKIKLEGSVASLSEEERAKRSKDFEYWQTMKILTQRPAKADLSFVGDATNIALQQFWVLAREWNLGKSSIIPKRCWRMG